MMRGGVSWELATPADFVNVTDCGWLPANCASDGIWHGMEKHIVDSRQKRKLSGKTPPTEKITYVWHEADIPHWWFPTMAEDAMAWPIGWTDSAPLETGKFRQWQRSHGQS